MGRFAGYYHSWFYARAGYYVCSMLSLLTSPPGMTNTYQALLSQKIRYIIPHSLFCYPRRYNNYYTNLLFHYTHPSPPPRNPTHPKTRYDSTAQHSTTPPIHPKTQIDKAEILDPHRTGTYRITICLKLASRPDRNGNIALAV